MDTEDARKGRVGVSQADESSSRASLQLELRVLTSRCSRSFVTRSCAG